MILLAIAGVNFVGRPLGRLGAVFRTVFFGFDLDFLAVERLTLRSFARATPRQPGGVVPLNWINGASG